MARKPPVLLPEELWDKLWALEIRVKRLNLLRGAGITAIVAATVIAIGLIVDWRWELSLWMRIALPLAAFTTIASTLWWVVLRPWYQEFSPADLAALIEQQHPELGERLTSTIELHDPDIPAEHKGSQLMRDLLTRQTIRAVEHLEFRDTVDATRPLRIGLCGLAAALLLFVPALLSPDGYVLALSRFLMPWGNFERPSNLYFEVEQGDRVVARGSDVTLRASPRWHAITGELPETAWLNWTDASGETDRRRMQFDAATGHYITTLPHVFSPFQFEVSAERARSRSYRVDVVDAPAVTTLQLHVQPPAYTGYPATTLDGVVGEAKVFEQSQLQFRIQFNKPVTRAEFEWQRSTSGASGEVEAQGAAAEANLARVALTLAEDRMSATYEMSATESGAFAIRVTDEHGLSNADDPRRSVVVLADQPPQLVLAGTDRPVEVRPSDIYPIAATATDDVGIGALELHYQSSTGEKGVLEWSAADLGQRRIEAKFELDLSSLQLSAGAVVSYRVRAADDRPGPRPQEVWSESRTLRINPHAPPPGGEQIAARQDELRNALDEIREDLHAHREELSRLQKSADQAARRNNGFRENDRLVPLAREESQLADRLEQLAAAFSRHPLFANLSENAQNVAREDLAESSQHLEAARQAETLEKAAELRRTLDRVDTAEGKLDQLRERFQDLAGLENDLLELSRLARMAEKLSDEAIALDQRREEALQAAETPEEREALAKRIEQEQTELAAAQQDLVEALEMLLDERPELLEAAREAQLARAAELAQQAGQLASPQERLAEQLRKQADTAVERAADLAEAQEELLKQAEQLAAQAANMQAGNTSNSASTENRRPEAERLDPEVLHKAVEELRAGNLAAAEQAQQQAASELARLADELRKAANPPSEMSPDNEPSPASRAAAKTAEQLAALAETQRELRRRTQQSQAMNTAPSTGEQPDTADASAPQSASFASKGEAASAAESSPMPAAPPERSPGGPSPSGQTPAKQNPAGQYSPGQNPAEQAPARQSAAEAPRAVAEAQAAQRELVREAISLTRAVAAEAGLEAAETREAMALAQQVAKTSAELEAGQLPDAAATAQRAAQAAAAVREQLDTARPEPAVNPTPAQQRARNLASRQSEQAERLQQLASDPAARQAAQQQAQAQLAEATQALARELGEVAENLAQDPIDLPENSAEARSAQAAAQRASEAMQQALQQMQSGRPASAAQAAAAAAEALRQTAGVASASPGEASAGANPVLQSTAEEVARALAALQQAQTEMTARAIGSEPGAPSSEQASAQGSPMGQPASGQANQSPAGQAQSPQAGQPQSGLSQSGQPGAGQPRASQPGSSSMNSGQPGQNGPASALARSAERLRNAAQALAQAARQLQPGGTSSSSSGSPESSSESSQGDSGAGARGGTTPADMQALEAELQKQSGRRWGELPGQLQTEILQAASRQPNGDYARLIKMYFKEIARTQEPERPQPAGHAP